jgi:uncharacterized protein involved in exopolysaccharide biosynthesis
MKILVRHERAESVVSPVREAPVQLQTEVSEEELQSEAELLKSRDLLTKVVVVCNLDKLDGNSIFARIWNKISPVTKSENPQDDPRIPESVLALEKNLQIEPVKLTNLISVTYTSKDPELSVRVLNSLASLYFEKHLAMRRAPGEFDFFHQQAEEYRKALASAETQLATFGRDEGVVSPALEKEITVHKLADFEAASKETRAAISETQQRIHTLEMQLASLPPRMKTQVRTADNPQLMERLKSTLLDLELKRTELLTKFEPTYRPVQEVDTQISQTQKAIDAAERSPLRDETDDRDPTYEALRAELAKSNTELAALKARATGDAGLARAYQSEAERMGQEEIKQADLLRAQKADEDNYLLYLRKQEEARISDALDRQRISNVVVAEAATIPFKPQGRRLLIMMIGGFLACLLSVMLGFAVDYWNPSFRTPDEVESFLDSPVVAAFPKNG